MSFHALRDDTGIHLVDAGFVGARSRFARELKRHGWEHQPIRGILITHGHLDHILNVARLAEEYGAWIAAPALDASHYAGTAIYQGWAKVAGLLETFGKPMLGFRPFRPDRLLHDGDEIPVWHGLRAIHLPGHTAGHMGYYCGKLRLLFSADLFASYGKFSHLPPRIFNATPAEIPASFRKALALDLDGVLPNHADRATPAVHLERLKTLAASLS